MGDQMELDLRQRPELLQDEDPLQDREPTIFNSKLILFFVAIALFIALLFRQNDLSLLALLVLLVMAGSKMWSVLNLGQVTCETKAQQARVFAGETIVMETTVANRKFLPAWIRLEWPARHLAVVKDGNAQAVAQEAAILWHQQARFQQALTARRRGVYPAGPSRMQASDLFGFFRTEKQLPRTNTIIVYPRLVDVKKVDLPRRDLFGKPGSQHPVKDPVYITGTRDYRAASPARHIHWKASARHARLQEKVFEPSQQGKIMVVLDVDGFSKKALENEFEGTLEVIASLCLQIEDAGMALGFATNGSTLGGDFSLAPTGQGPRQVPAVLEALARVEMKPGKSLTETMQQAVIPMRGISCICFAYDVSSELEHMHCLCRQKHIPLSLFVHQFHDPPQANQKIAAADALPIEDLLTAREAPL